MPRMRFVSLALVVSLAAVVSQAAADRGHGDSSSAAMAAFRVLRGEAGPSHGNGDHGNGNGDHGNGNGDHGNGNGDHGNGNDNRGQGAIQSSGNAGNANGNGGDANANAHGGNPNAAGGNPNAAGGNPNAAGGNPNAAGGNPNAAGGNANAGGGTANKGVGSQGKGQGAKAPTALPVPANLADPPVISEDWLPVPMRPQTSANVVVANRSGRVFVQDGSNGFVPMGTAGRIPVGSFVDARAGVVTMADRQPDGSIQTASFTGSKFQVRQAADGTTDIVLRGSSFSKVCGAPTRAKARSASATPMARTARRHRHTARWRHSKRRVRSLWSSDHNGRYKTHGRNSVATVRGTIWQTVDRCDGTLVRVAQGEVSVWDRHTHHRVTVRAGHSYLARTPGS